jgi:hypothetical protein
MAKRVDCCVEMREQIDHTCSHHPGAGTCPDQVVAYLPKRGEYGLWIRDGEDGAATSYLVIRFCPWCGKRLFKKKPPTGGRRLALELLTD